MTYSTPDQTNSKKNHLPFNVTYFIPVFGLPIHIQSFIYSSDYSTKNNNFFGCHILSNFYQNISKNYTNSILLEKFNHKYYCVDDNYLIRGFPLKKVSPRDIFWDRIDKYDTFHSNYNPNHYSPRPSPISSSRPPPIPSTSPSTPISTPSQTPQLTRLKPIADDEIIHLGPNGGGIGGTGVHGGVHSSVHSGPNSAVNGGVSNGLNNNRSNQIDEELSLLHPPKTNLPPPMTARKIYIPTLHNGIRIPFILMSFFQGYTAMLESKAFLVLNFMRYAKPPKGLDFQGFKLNTTPLSPRYSKNTPYCDDNGQYFYPPFDLDGEGNGVGDVDEKQGDGKKSGEKSKTSEKSKKSKKSKKSFQKRSKNDPEIPLSEFEIIPSTNPPPPTCFQIIPTLEYNYERLIPLPCFDRVPAFHIATVLLLHVTDKSANLMLSNFILKTTQSLSKGSILPLIDVPIHVILLDDHLIDMRLLNKAQISERLIEIGISADQIIFHSVPLSHSFHFNPKATLTTHSSGNHGLNNPNLPNTTTGHKTNQPISMLTDVPSLDRVLEQLWSLIFVKHFELNETNYFKRIGDDVNDVKLVSSEFWPSYYYTGQLLEEKNWSRGSVLGVKLGDLMRSEKKMVNKLRINKQVYRNDIESILQREILKFYRNWLLSPNGINGEPIYPEHFDTRKFSLFSKFEKDLNVNERGLNFGKSSSFLPHKFHHLSNPRPIQFPDIFNSHAHNNGLELDTRYTALYLPLKIDENNEESRVSTSINSNSISETSESRSYEKSFFFPIFSSPKKCQFQNYVPRVLPAGILPRKYEFEAFIMTGDLLVSYQHAENLSGYPRVQNSKNIWAENNYLCEQNDKNDKNCELQKNPKTDHSSLQTNKKPTTSPNKPQPNTILQPLLDFSIQLRNDDKKSSFLYDKLRKLFFERKMKKIFGYHAYSTQHSLQIIPSKSIPGMYPFIQMLHQYSTVISQHHFRSTFSHRIKNDEIIKRLEGTKCFSTENNQNEHFGNSGNSACNQNHKKDEKIDEKDDEEKSKIQINLTYLIRPMELKENHSNRTHFGHKSLLPIRSFSGKKQRFDQFIDHHYGQSLSFQPGTYLYGVILLPFMYTNKLGLKLLGQPVKGFLGRNQGGVVGGAVGRGGGIGDSGGNGGDELIGKEQLDGEVGEVGDGNYGDNDDDFIQPLIPSIIKQNCTRWGGDEHFDVDWDYTLKTKEEEEWEKENLLNNEEKLKKIEGNTFWGTFPPIKRGFQASTNGGKFGLSPGHLNCPIHFVVLCLNDVVDKDGEIWDGSDQNEQNDGNNSNHNSLDNPPQTDPEQSNTHNDPELEPLTIRQFSYIKQHGPIIWKRQLISLFFQPFCFISPEKLDNLINVHFVQIDNFNNFLKNIENDAIDLQMEIFNDHIDRFEAE